MKLTAQILTVAFLAFAGGGVACQSQTRFTHKTGIPSCIVWTGTAEQFDFCKRSAAFIQTQDDLVYRARPELRFSQLVPDPLPNATVPPAAPSPPIVLAPVQAAPAAPAGATASVPQPDGSTIYLYPLIHDLEPFIVTVLGALITSIGGWMVAALVAFLKKRGDVAVSQDVQAQATAALKIFADAATTKAGEFVLQSDPSWKTAQIQASHPWIANAANEVIATSTDLAAKSGMTPDILAGKIAGEIGKLQAAPVAAVVAPVVAQ